MGPVARTQAQLNAPDGLGGSGAGVSLSGAGREATTGCAPGTKAHMPVTAKNNRRAESEPQSQRGRHSGILPPAWHDTSPAITHQLVRGEPR